ncbi:MAG: MBL fold metallo-hydrolase [Candidatus Hodarchaeota archaeon]
MSISRELLKITLLPLGTCAGNTTVYQKHSAHLLEIQDNHKRVAILLDAGNKRVKSNRLYDIDDLELILISHDHLDHCLYIGALVQKLNFRGRRRKLKIISHVQAIKRIRVLIKIWNLGRIPRFVEFMSVDLPPRMDATFDVPPINLGNGGLDEIQIEIATIMARHTPSTIAYRLKIKHAAIQENALLDLVFSPDTSFKSDHLVQFAQHAGFWLLDTTFATWEIQKQIKEYTEGKRGARFPGHSSPEYSARLCERAGVQNYVMVHYFWSRFARHFKDVKGNLSILGKKCFSRNIIIATELEPIILFHE